MSRFYSYLRLSMNKLCARAISYICLRLKLDNVILWYNKLFTFDDSVFTSGRWNLIFNENPLRDDDKNGDENEDEDKDKDKDKDKDEDRDEDEGNVDDEVDKIFDTAL